MHESINNSSFNKRILSIFKKPGLESHRLWRNFAGISQEEALTILKASLKEKGCSYSVKKDSGRMMLSTSASHSYNLTIMKPINLQILIFEATADPFARLLTKMIGNLYKHYGGLCFFEISFLEGKQSKQLWAELAKVLAKKGTRTPWDVTHHPRFQMAFMLKFITKRRWTELIKE